MSAITIPLFIVAIITSFVQNVASKSSGDRIGTFAEQNTFSLLRGSIGLVIAVIVAACTGGFAIGFSSKAALFGLMGGINLTVCFITGMVAFSSGGAVMFVSVFSKCSLFVTVVYSWLFLGEPFSLWGLLGIFLIIAASLCMCFYKGGKVRVNFRIIIMSLLLGLCDGLMSLSQKLFTYYEPGGNVGLYNVWMLGVATALMLPITLISARGKPTFGFLRTNWLQLIIMSVTIFAVNQFMTMLAVSVPAYILYPVFTAAGVVLSPVAGLPFKEKITLGSVAGMALAVAGIVCMYLPV